MNIIVLLTFITVLVISVNSSNENFAQVNQLLEDVRKIFGSKELFNGSKGTRAPILDKFEFENQKLDMCGFVMCIRANITKGTLQGVGGYELLKSQFESDGTKVSLDLDINFPSLFFESEYYEMEGNIMEAFPLAGKGKLQFGVNNLRLWTKVELSILEDGPTIDDFANPGFSIQNIICRIEFDGNIDDIFNTMVEELVPGYLNRFNKAIAAHYTEVLKELLNPILRI